MDTPNTTKQTVLSIGPGMLGIERGIEAAIGKLHVAAYVEIETFIIENLTSFMEAGLLDPAPVWADLKTFDPNPFHNKIHGIIAGYPCQPFSLVGKRAGTDDPRHLYPYIESSIHAIRPFWCFFENVAGHLTLGFDHVYQSLRSLGYRVEAGLYSAEEIGAPHVRERLFILALDDTRYTEWQRGQQTTQGSKRGSKPRPQFAPSDLFDPFGEMENPRSQRNGGRHHAAPNRRCEIQTEGSSTLEHPHESGLRGINEGGLHPEAQPASEKEMGYTIDRRQQKQRDQGFQQSRTINHPNPQNFPLPPGPFQFQWEAPRILKPGLGCSVNGYNYREDLLRMYGNGVVWPTATKAFTELWSKHLNQ